MAKITEKDYNLVKNLQPTSGIEKDDMLGKVVKTSRRTMEAYLPQSGYSIVLSAFNRDELLSLQSLIKNEETYREETYKIIHSHIVSTSLGELTLEQFLTHTSYLDLDTLAYLMFTATFKDKGTYSFSCLNHTCNLPIDVTLNNSTLVKTDSKKYEELRVASLKEKLTVEELRKKDDFFLNNVTYLKLEDSKYLVALREPSLADDSWALRRSSDKRLVNDRDMLDALSCVVEFKKPIEGEKEEAVSIRDKDEILNILKGELEFYDQKEILDEVDNILYGKLINYTINKVKCPHCGQEYEDLPISMSNALFYTIYIEV